MRPSVVSPLPLVAPDDFASAVAASLSERPRQLPSRYFYDELGSSLFGAICNLPWYRITRAECALLAAHGAEMLASMSPLSRIIELGPGNGEKLATLVRVCAPDTRCAGRPLVLHLIDVSARALEEAQHALAPLHDVELVTDQAAYADGLVALGSDRQPDGHTLVLFLGSNIGNFDRVGAEAFLRGVRATLGPGDGLLLGADLVKPERDLLLAYDDPLGVTAAFNRNLLVRMARELGAELDLEAFAHRALWNSRESRVEMHLVSQRNQRVRIASAGLDFVMDEGETIWTERSYKYRPEEILTLLERAGFSASHQWLDGDAGFCVTRARVV